MIKIQTQNFCIGFLGTLSEDHQQVKNIACTIISNTGLSSWMFFFWGEDLCNSEKISLGGGKNNSWVSVSGGSAPNQMKTAQFELKNNPMDETDWLDVE